MPYDVTRLIDLVSLSETDATEKLVPRRVYELLCFAWKLIHDYGNKREAYASQMAGRTSIDVFKIARTSDALHLIQPMCFL